MIRTLGAVLWAASLLHVGSAVAQSSPPQAPPPALVIQTDFGTRDGAVAEMKGVAYGIGPSLHVVDLTHEIPAFDIWTAAYRLVQVAPYWPAGTVFVSVVDPGVGTSRRSIVARSRTGQYFVTPDNGTLTLIADQLGIAEVREIDERVNRYPGSEHSYTFHGRDVYAYTGARLAAGVIQYEQVGPALDTTVVRLPYQHVELRGDALSGAIPILDLPYGNVWTNIDAASFDRLHPNVGERFAVRVYHGSILVWQGTVPYAHTFGDVKIGAPLLYLNSLGNVALALNQGNFAASHRVESGARWRLELRRAPAATP